MGTQTDGNNIMQVIQNATAEAATQLYGTAFTAEQISISDTRKEVEGDYTVIVFPFTKAAGKKPADIGEELGTMVVANNPNLISYNVIKGFLNFTVADAYWLEILDVIRRNESYGQRATRNEKVVVEFASPNTNKPLHLGHIRNILLGWSVSKILTADGYEVKKVQIVNDRGIAICRSMLAWKRWGEGETPESSGMKGDHLVGKYYVRFASEFMKEYAAWQESAEATTAYDARPDKYKSLNMTAYFKEFKNDYFNTYSKLGSEARAMLISWEAKDDEVRELWKKMNGWVLSGFEATYMTMGVDFDKLYFESDTYLLGKEIIAVGLTKGIMQQEDKRILVDLESIGFANKTVIKSDGTSTYTSQDLGTAQLRWNDYAAKKMIYVVGDEQISHFQSLFEILKRLEEPYADGLYHLAYGMVDLPSGRMKSREGNVVDADELMNEVKQIARKNLEERGELEVLTNDEKEKIIDRIALGALKYYILKVNPSRRMVFNPEESLDMQGDTGPYIQNAYVRIQSILRKANPTGEVLKYDYPILSKSEKDLIILLASYPDVIRGAAAKYDPSDVAAFNYAIAKTFHKFYHDMSIMKAESEDARNFRITLATEVARILQKGMDMIGVEMPDRM